MSNECLRTYQEQSGMCKKKRKIELHVQAMGCKDLKGALENLGELGDQRATTHRHGVRHSDQEDLEREGAAGM